MQRLCCCSRPAAVHPAPPAAHTLPLDLVADLPPHTRDSSAVDSSKERKSLSIGKNSPIVPDAIVDTAETTIDLVAEDHSLAPPPPRSPSIHIEDYSEKSNASLASQESRSQISLHSNEGGSRKSSTGRSADSPSPSAPSRRVSITSRSGPATPVSGRSAIPSPEPTSNVFDPPAVPSERDVRASLAGCIVPARHEDWEAIVTGLAETERLAEDAGARAPAASWRAAARGAAAHVRSLRSRVARAACRTVGALFQHRGRVLDSELDEATSALLERSADANRFLRGDAAEALGQVACGSSVGRSAVTLARRGACHRAGPVRAAAAAALARLVRHAGAARALDLPSEARAMLLRAAGDLLTDASPEARAHARHLCLTLAEDARFRPLLKEAMPSSRYRNVDKLLDKLQCQ